ncbi:MAG TPA: DUF58 domain-containing protein [Anaerolineae bacterium]
MADVPVLLVLLLLIAILLQLDFVFYLVYLGAGTYALARWWTGRSLPALRVQRRLSDHMFLGQDADVEIEIANARWWPVPWLRFDENLPINLQMGQPVRRVVSLAPKERLRLTYQVSGRRRGYYAVGPLQLKTGDLFGFAQAGGRVITEDHITVYPYVVPLAQVHFQSRAPYGTIKSRQRIFADPTRIAGKREYLPGDPLHSIDWKSSSHSGSLQVKKYDPAVALASVILLNLRPEEYSRHLQAQASEWGIVVAASLASYLVRERQPVGLGSNGTDTLTGAHSWIIPPRPGRAHLMKLLEWLARVELTNGLPPFASWLPAATAGLAWGTMVIVVSPSADGPDCQALHHLVRAGLTPVLLAIEPHYRLGPLQERARRLGFTALIAADEHDLLCL